MESFKNLNINYCKMCGNTLEFESLEYCGKNECWIKFCNKQIEPENLPSEAKVINYIKNNTESAATILYLISESKIDSIKPKPENYTENQIQTILKKDFNQIDICLKKDTQKYYDNLIESIIKTCNYDIEIMANFSEDFYYIIRFFLLSLKKYIFKTNLGEKNLENSNFTCYKISHDYTIEKNFDNLVKINSHDYLFHGSVIGNWYSILANGIKIYSGTNKMLNGQAHGPGIYLSDDFNVSSAYTRSGGKSILAVYEVIGSKEQYKKTSNIYVVPKDSLLILRYLIINNSNSNANKIVQTTNIQFVKDNKGKEKMVKEGITLAQFVSKHFTNTILIKESQKEIKLSKTSSKRLMKEYQKLLLEGKEHGIQVSLDNENLNKWFVKLSDFPSNTLFYKDLVESKYNEVLLSIQFDRYPYQAPFIHVISPRFTLRTAHITSGGSVCLESLTTSGWLPAMNIESVLIQIKALIIDGEGTLDFNNTLPYQYSLAKKSFELVAKAHGWLN
jgi:ubiquitin-protein ligase